LPGRAKITRKLKKSTCLRAPQGMKTRALRRSALVFIGSGIMEAGKKFGHFLVKRDRSKN
jgi:hypothetical protein